MNPYKTDWPTEWEATNSAVVTHIRHSFCGRYIEKKFSCKTDKEETFAIQAECYDKGKTPLQCWHGLTQLSYISDAAVVLDKQSAQALFEYGYPYSESGVDWELDIGNNSELNYAWRQHNGCWHSFIEPILEHVHNMGGDEVLVEDFLDLAVISNLDFDDNHWENVGIFKGQLVCIDFDCDFNKDAAEGILA